MCKALENLEKKGREDMLRDLVAKKLQKGKSIEEIADALEQEYSVIQEIVDGLKTTTTTE